jgi:acetyl-CoA C-acetyltransferase
MTMKDIYLVGAARTPIGRFGGALAGLTPAELGEAAARASLGRARLSAGDVQEVIWGCARQAGGGPNVARQIGYRAGLPETVPAFTVNQACGSGLKAIILAAQEIMLGRARAVLAGGVESMSRVPYFAEGARWGTKMGHVELVDGMYRDGFSDPLSGLVMGETAENLARRYEIARGEQDEFALRSQRRAAAAIDSGRFDEEIAPVELAGRKGEAVLFSRDEHPRADTSIESLRKLAPVFSKTGTVTAGNSSGITDGAAAVCVMGEEALGKTGATPLARIVDYEIAGVDLVELNEAFAAQVIACDRELKLDAERLNVNGGAIALGHPIGCTGVRITTTLLYEMKRRSARLGLSTLCVSGGLGLALLVERV